VDRGYRVIVSTDAICSSFDTTHDALLILYRQRFAEPIETTSAHELLAAWP
jgi:nicotinamidase-related amidase